MDAVLKFVNTIQASPAVRLDLNDGSVWATSAETNFGIPAMKRSVTSSMMRDGEYVGASAYGNREITLVLKLLSLNADTAASQYQTLVRELDRPTNILQYHPTGATHPVFFRTFRTSLDAFDWPAEEIVKEIRVTLLAEPFALGTVEISGSTAVRNDPTLTNGLFLNLTGVKGDVETPLFIEYDEPSSLFRAGYAVGVRSGTAFPGYFIQAESYTTFFDTSVVADAAASGGSKMRCTFAGFPTMSHRIHGNFPVLIEPAGQENWGTYRVFARVAKTTTDGTMLMQASSGGGLPTQSVTLKNITAWQMVDLGVHDATSGLPTVGGYNPTTYRIETEAELWVRAQRASGTGSLDIDYLVFVPADQCYGQWRPFGEVTVNSYMGVADGLNDAVYTATSLTSGAPGRGSIYPSSSISGMLPRVRPGDNRLVIVQTGRTNSSGVEQGHNLTGLTSFTFRYWPRYISVKPVGT